MEKRARAHLASFHSAMKAHPTEARAFLNGILAAPLRFTPEGKRFRIEGEISLETGVLGGLPNVASPRGFETGNPSPSHN